MSTFASSSSSVSSEVDAAIWRALAGSTVHIPTLNSYVYYFPQGHLEHSSDPAPADSASDSPSAPALAATQKSDPTLKRPFFPCQVISMGFHFNPISDQAFVKLILQPVNHRSIHIRVEDDLGQNDVVSFSKILTPSDANNGGGFSIPRYCADSILPQLNFLADPPVQNLIMKDSHNNAWEFRHIYRGTPRRHLLTTGWSKFVNAKRLVTGDSVVFMRKRSTGELFIGVRRAARFGGENGWGSDNSREAAIKAMENADRGMAFEVVYYPRVGLPDFVVSAEKVENALKIYWAPGMRVRMPVETEDYSRITVFSGIIMGAAPPQSGPWFGSPWRMLQVSWDEPVNVESMNSVSPWQVEWFQSTEEIPPPIFPPFKRLRGYQNQEILLPNEEADFSLSLTNGSTSAHPNSGAVFNYGPRSAGIQRARIDHIGLSSSRSDNSFKTLFELFKSNGRPAPKTISDVLNIGSSLSENLSPCSQGSVDFDDQPEGHRLTSIQLFGTIIQSYVPVEGGGSSKSNGCRDDERNELYKETNVLNNQPSPSV